MRSLRALLAALLLMTTSAQAGPEDIGIHHPFATVSSSGPVNGAAYMLIHNHSDHDDRLLTASSPASQRVEIRAGPEAEGLADGVEIRAGDELELAPSGIHLALLGLTQPLRDGDVLTLTLVFDKAGEMTFRLPVDFDRLVERAPTEHSDHGN